MRIKSIKKEIKDVEFGCNPCSEILLRSSSFCNLTEVVVRPEDTYEDLKEKVRLATILGTFQATLTNFKGLTAKWRRNTEEEALLGVSFTGIMDHPVLSGRTEGMADIVSAPIHKRFGHSSLDDVLEELREYAVEVNKEWAEKLGINQAAAVTCVKPSGTVSQLVDSASGIHTRYSPYYIRTVRADKKDPLATMMVNMGFPVEDDVTKPDSGYVFSFPMRAPEHAVFRDDLNVIQQLEIWKTYQLHWTEHKPSVTVYVKEHEWLDAGAWVYENFDMLSGISFLPHSDHTYKQAPYQEISEAEYEQMFLSMPKDVDWSLLGEYEQEDTTESYKELACTGGSCELS